jgi:hypothetical protein
MPFTIVSFLVMAGRGGKTSLQRGVSWYFVFHFESDREAHGQSQEFCVESNGQSANPRDFRTAPLLALSQLLPSVNRHIPSLTETLE